MLALALWKPWDTGVEESARLVAKASPSDAIPSERRPSPSPAAVPSQAPTQAPTDPGAIACISATGWRVVTRDVTAGRESRTWIAVDPAAAIGLEDRSISSVRIVVGRLMAIGYCVPAELSDVARDARLWRMDPDWLGPGAPLPGRPRVTATTVPVSPLRTLAARAPGFADIYGPPKGERRWTAGRYVFAVEHGRSDGSVWFSIEVVDSEPVPD